jgi:DNA-binding transcriptional regulator LsrR (DeoR family)
MINQKESKAVKRKINKNLNKKLMADYLAISQQELLQVANNHYSEELAQPLVLAYLEVTSSSHHRLLLEAQAFSKVEVSLEVAQVVHYLEVFLQEDLFLTQLLLSLEAKTLYLKLLLLMERKTMKKVKIVEMMIILVKETEVPLLTPQVKM